MQLQRIVIDLSQIGADRLQLRPEQDHYLRRVLRLRPGDRFIAVDGQGHWWLSELLATDAQILEELIAQTELPVVVTLLIAMPKGSGMDDLLPQVTELGVATIVPIMSDRTLLNPSPQKLDRWRRIVQEAAEQSERQLVPQLRDPMSWAQALQEGQETTVDRYLCEARGDRPHLMTQLLNGSTVAPQPIAIAIGPEGGWTAAEIEAAIAVGYQPVSLGQRILRTVTAPVVAMTMIASVFESMPQPMSQD